MGYFSADRVRWVTFFGVPLAFLVIYEDTSSVTAVAFDCFLAVFILRNEYVTRGIEGAL